MFHWRKLSWSNPDRLVSTPSQLPRDPHLSFVDSGIGRFIHSPQCVSAVLWNSGWFTPMFSPVSTCLWKRFGWYALLPTWKIFKLQTNTTWKRLDLYKNQLLIRQPFLSFLESFYFRENQGDGSDSFQEWKCKMWSQIYLTPRFKYTFYHIL